MLANGEDQTHKLSIYIDVYGAVKLSIYIDVDGAVKLSIYIDVYGAVKAVVKVSLYKVARTQQQDFCWIHSFKSFVENLGLCGVYFYYMSEYPFNKYYMCF